jgi:hypothetical protein
VTLPDERYRAVRMAEQFLTRLAGGHYARVPKAVREDMDSASEYAVHVFQPQLDPLYKMIKQHELADQVREELEEHARVHTRNS